MVGYIHQRIASYELADPETDRGKEYLEATSRERAQDLPPPFNGESEKVAVEAREATKRLERLLIKPQYKEIEAEFQAMRKKRNRPPAWYSLFGGPRNLSLLAQHVNWWWAYLVLYRRWSSIAHPTDASRFLTKTPERSGGFYSLRNPKELAWVAFLGAAFNLDATRLLIRKFRPGEDVAPWYSREVRDRFFRLQRMRVKIVDA